MSQVQSSQTSEGQSVRTGTGGHTPNLIRLVTINEKEKKRDNGVIKTDKKK